MQLAYVGIDELTGETLWERTGDPFWSSNGFGLPTTIATADALLLSSAGAVEAIDPRTGEPLWSRAVPGDVTRMLALEDGLLVFSHDQVIRLG